MHGDGEVAACACLPAVSPEGLAWQQEVTASWAGDNHSKLFSSTILYLQDLQSP